MKNTTFLWLLLLSSTAQAAILTLNNNNPSPGQYTTFAAAHDAASAGDTILVHGSPTHYGGITITKRLTLIGPGHKPNTTWGLGATILSIFISNNLTGVRIYGIIVGGINGPGGGILTNVDSLVIENVFFSNGGAISAGTNCNHLVIRGSVFQNSIIRFFDTNIDGVIVENNYFSSNDPLWEWGNTGNKMVSNNIFAASGTGNLVVAGTNIRNTIFRNNIFYGLTANSGIQTNCLYENNLSFGHNTNNNLPPAGQAGSGNLVNVNPQFVNVQAPNEPSPAEFFSYTRNYRLQPGSPGLGAGTGGTNLGIYESDHEFSMTGEPARPQTTTVTTPASVPLGGAVSTSFTIRKATPNAQ